MRYGSLLLTMSLAGSILVSCSGSGVAGEYDIEHGPFDANGNYIEAWANGRPKSSWKKKKKKSQVAKKKATPKKKEPSIVRAKKNEQPEWLSKKPSKEKPKTSPSSKKSAKPKYAAKPNTKPKAQYSKPKATSKPKPVVIKTKVKPPVRHTVAKGDTLYNISRRYGSTVNSIQKANRLSGTNIRLGQVLMVPIR